MRHPAKGEYGYLRAQTKRTAWTTVLLFVMSAVVFILGVYTRGVAASGLPASEALRLNPIRILRLGDKKNLLTVVSMLGVLPAARYLVQLILLLRAGRYACTSQQHERISTAAGDRPMLYDIYLTGYERSYPMACMSAGEGALLGLSADNGLDAAAAEGHLRDALQRDGIKGVTVKVFMDEKKFLDRVAALASHTQVPDDATQRVLQLIREISL